MGVWSKKSRGNTVVHSFLQSIWVHTLREYGVDDTCMGSDTSLMLYKTSKAMVWSQDGDIITGDLIAPHMTLIYQEYVLPTLIDIIQEKGFTLKKISRRYLTETMADADDKNDEALLKNSPS